MKFVGPLIAISDLEASKKFYEEVLGQKNRIRPRVERGF